MTDSPIRPVPTGAQTVLLAVTGILNSTRLFAVAGDSRSRVNTASVTADFVAGAIGSAAAGLLWSAGGRTAVTVAGLILGALGLAGWAAGRRGPLLVRRPSAAQPR